jgi:hypothetical protein
LGWVYLGRVGLVWGMQLVEADGHSLGFDYKGETCEPRSVLATRVRLVSLWPLITMSNIAAWLCLIVV